MARVLRGPPLPPGGKIIVERACSCHLRQSLGGASYTGSSPARWRSLGAAFTPPVPSASAAPRQGQTSTSRRKVGIALGGEQFPPTQLVQLAQAAEQAGFDGLWVTDHSPPWQANQQHAGQAWVLLSAIGSRTSRISIGTGVTTPTVGYHPAVVAQTFATLASLVPPGSSWGSERARR